MSNPPKILVVDDEPMIVALLERWLEERYEVLKAGDGKEALDLIESSPDVDLVVLDILMPVMDGLELLRKLRERDPPLRVVVMSARHNSLYLTTAAKLGASGVLYKPFEKLEVQKVLQNALVAS